MDLNLDNLPLPWKPITSYQDDVELQEVWAYWRSLYPDMAATVTEELQREVSQAHPLAGVSCEPMAWGLGGKEFAFLTDRSDMPVVVVHLTFSQEDEPWLPAIWGCESVEAFVRHRRHVEERKQERRLTSRSEGTV